MIVHLPLLNKRIINNSFLGFPNWHVLFREVLPRFLWTCPKKVAELEITNVADPATIFFSQRPHHPISPFPLSTTVLLSRSCSDDF